MLTPSDLSAIIQKASAGDPWYGSSTQFLIAGLSASEAAARPIMNGHSIWEILLHMISWLREVERRLGGNEPELPIEGDWPEIPDTSEAAWERTKVEFNLINQRLCASLISLNQSIWGCAVGTERDREIGTGISNAEMIVGVIQHNAYHTGQIGLLLKLIRLDKHSTT